MWKGKFGMGFGLGIICGALLLQMMLLAQSLSSEAPSLVPEDGWMETGDATAGEGWTEQQLHAAAEELGYNVYPKREKLYSETELEEEIRQALEAEGGPRIIRWIMVPNGATSEEVAELLAEAGLIADKQVWLDMLTERGLHSRIRAGIYTFSEQPDEEEVAERLTD